MAEAATAEGPPRRRASWSLRTIVEDVAGKPIEELQDPGRPVHPYLKARPPPSAKPPDGEEPGCDPVDRLTPPLIGETGRAFHGAAHEHHQETIDRHPGPGPLRRPERLYLHYLLLHIDRLNGSALLYLRGAIDEELRHRASPDAQAPAPRARRTAPDP